MQQLRSERVAVLLLASLLSGCQVLGIVADKMIPPTVQAQYEIGKTTQLLVIAENYRNATQGASDADRVAALVGEELTGEQAALVVSPEKLLLVKDLKPTEYAKMSVIDLGRAVGAQQVLYIDFGGIGVGAQAGSDVFKGVGSARVKVIDVSSGEVLFPKDMDEGIPVTYESPMRRASERATPDSIRSETVLGLGGKIARLFHSYHPDDIEVIEHDVGGLQ